MSETDLPEIGPHEEIGDRGYADERQDEPEGAIGELGPPAASSEVGRSPGPLRQAPGGDEAAQEEANGGEQGKAEGTACQDLYCALLRSVSVPGAGLAGGSRPSDEQRGEQHEQADADDVREQEVLPQERPEKNPGVRRERMSATQVDDAGSRRVEPPQVPFEGGP